MEVVPVSVGVASRAWDEQHLELAAASRQIERAGTAGFTVPVAEAGTRFLEAWAGFAGDLGSDCEDRADRLRAVVAAYVGSDEASFADLLALGGYLVELR